MSEMDAIGDRAGALGNGTGNSVNCEIAEELTRAHVLGSCALILGLVWNFGQYKALALKFSTLIYYILIYFN